MAQTKEGAKKARETIRSRYGVTEDGKSMLHIEIGAIGGAKSRGYKFGHGKVDPRVAGAKGGAKSRRRPASYKVGDKDYLL